MMQFHAHTPEVSRDAASMRPTRCCARPPPVPMPPSSANSASTSHVCGTGCLSLVILNLNQWNRVLRISLTRVSANAAVVRQQRQHQPRLQHKGFHREDNKGRAMRIPLRTTKCLSVQETNAANGRQVAQRTCRRSRAAAAAASAPRASAHSASGSSSGKSRGCAHPAALSPIALAPPMPAPPLAAAADAAAAMPTGVPDPAERFDSEARRSSSRMPRTAWARVRGGGAAAGSASRPSHARSSCQLPIHAPPAALPACCVAP